VHFLEAESAQLKELTASPLVQKSFLLISEKNFFQALKSVRVMTRISKFFRELSEENVYAKELLTEQMAAYLSQWADNISEENCEFVANLSIFYYNMLEAKNGRIAFLADADIMGFFAKVTERILSL